jgi:hypothetical protein
MRRITWGINGYEMPNYLICSTDKDDYAHILINLCPYFFEQQAKITVQAINALANIEILGKDDYIVFEEWVGIKEYPRFGQPITVDANTKTYGIPSGISAGLIFHTHRLGDYVWKYQDGWVIWNGPIGSGTIEITLVYTNPGWVIKHKIEGLSEGDKNYWRNAFLKFSCWDDPGIYRTSSWYQESHMRKYSVPSNLPPGTMFKPYHMWPVEWQYTDGWRIFTEDEAHPEHTRMAAVAQIPENGLYNSG